MFSVYVHIAPNNKKYFGITSQNPENRWLSGYGYSTQQLMWRAIQKYGWDNFQHIILADNLSKEWACKVEQDLIWKYQSNNPKCGYNISTGGDGPFGVVCSQETKEKLRQVNLGKHHTEETKRKISEHSDHHNKGMKLSKERLDKLNNARRGKPAWNSGKKLSDEYRQKLSDSHKGQKAWNKGVPGTEEMKRKVSEANKGKPAWNKGIKLSKSYKQQISESLKNRIWVNNGSHRTLIHPEELQKYLDNGYVKGKGRKQSIRKNY